MSTRGDNTNLEVNANEINKSSQEQIVVVIKNNTKPSKKEPSPDGNRTRADWEAIERAYRAGMLSIREIAKQHSLSDKAIRNKAKEFGWERDLSEKINEKVRAELVRSQSATADSEREIIDTAAATVVHVVRSHRKRITKQAAVVDLLTEQLAEAAQKREEIEDTIHDETQEDSSGQRRAAMLRAVSLQTHSTIAVNLSNAMKTLVGMERQAFNIKDESEAPVSALGELLKQVSGTGLPIVTDNEAE